MKFKITFTKSKTDAYVMIYSLFLLFLVSFFIANLRFYDGVFFDRISNSHVHFQSLLYLQSLDKIAHIYANNKKTTQARFDFGGGYIGGFAIQEKKAFLYVEAQNKRTSQILRATKIITLNK